MQTAQGQVHGASDDIAGHRVAVGRQEDARGVWEPCARPRRCTGLVRGQRSHAIKLVLYSSFVHASPMSVLKVLSNCKSSNGLLLRIKNILRRCGLHVPVGLLYTLSRFQRVPIEQLNCSL